MQRWFTVAVAALGIVFVGADAPPSSSPVSESVTIFNTTDLGGGLTPLQTAYVTAKVAQLLDARGVAIDRSTERPDSFQKFGDLLCSHAKTAALLWPAVSTTVTGREEGGAAWNTVHLELRFYDCGGHSQRVFASGTYSSYDWTDAVDKSIADALKHYASGR